MVLLVGLIIAPVTDDSRAVAAVRDLWREYWNSLGLADDFQGFADELRSLPGRYAKPAGCLLLAGVDEEPAATAALRPLSADACEAKRLYVRPEFRRRGIAEALLLALIDEARAAGYRAMYGDTLPSMSSALELYRRLGFTEVDPYSANPTPGAIYLRLAL